MLTITKKKLGLGALLGLALLASPVLEKKAEAYHNNHGSRHGMNSHYAGGGHVLGRGCGTPRHLSYISDLSDEEHAVYRSMVAKYNDEVSAWRIELANKQATYHTLVRSNNPKPSEVGKLAGDIESLRQKLLKADAKFADDIYQKFGK